MVLESYGTFSMNAYVFESFEVKISLTSWLKDDSDLLTNI